MVDLGDAATEDRETCQQDLKIFYTIKKNRGHN